MLEDRSEGRLREIKGFAEELDKAYWAKKGPDVLLRASEVERYYGELQGLEYLKSHKTPYMDKILGILKRLDKGPEYVTYLYKDFAPLSMTFSVHRIKGMEFWYNGGVIYYGKGQMGIGGPQFSVRLEDNGEEHSWQINT